MSVQLFCHCGGNFLTPDTNIGSAVACPQCQTHLNVPDVRTAYYESLQNAQAGGGDEPVFDELDELDDYDRPSRKSKLGKKSKPPKKKSKKIEALGIVRIGLILLLVGLVVPGASLVGAILCCWAPEKSRVRPMIIASMVLSVVGPLILVLAWFLGATAVLSRVQTMGAQAAETQISAMLLGASMIFLWLIVFAAINLTSVEAIRRLADYIDADDAVGNGEKVLRMVVQSSICIGIGMLLSFVPFLPVGCTGLILFFGGGIYWMVAMVFTIIMVAQTLSALNQML